jgi:hypothetical protein
MLNFLNHFLQEALLLVSAINLMILQLQLKLSETNFSSFFSYDDSILAPWGVK